jgi:cyclic pyranopterin phosphate synthase
MPPGGVPEVGHGDLLTLELTARLVRTIHRVLGLSKIRITGGEPLVRKGVAGLISILPRGPEVSMTTNGLLLCESAAELAVNGLSRVNVSLDSLRDDVLRMITRRDASLEAVERGIRCARNAGLAPVKVNCVVLRGVNDGELSRMVEWGAGMGVRVRFIEHMPLADGDPVRETVFREEIADLAGGGNPTGTSGTEETWTRSDGLSFGVISPVSGNLCRDCGRVRLTAQGVFMPCLSGVGKVDLKPLVLSGAPEAEIEGAVTRAVSRKPQRGDCRSLPMWSIGG